MSATVFGRVDGSVQAQPVWTAHAPDPPAQNLEDLFQGEPSDVDPIAAHYGVRAAAVSDLYQPRWINEPSTVAPTTTGLVTSYSYHEWTPKPRRVWFGRLVELVLGAAVVFAVIVFVATAVRAVGGGSTNVGTTITNIGHAIQGATPSGIGHKITSVTSGS
jgi:hypothetical protein